MFDITRSINCLSLAQKWLFSLFCSLYSILIAQFTYQNIIHSYMRDIEFVDSIEFGLFKWMNVSRYLGTQQSFFFDLSFDFFFSTQHNTRHFDTLCQTKFMIYVFCVWFPKLASRFIYKCVIIFLEITVSVCMCGWVCTCVCLRLR